MDQETPNVQSVIGHVSQDPEFDFMEIASSKGDGELAEYKQKLIQRINVVTDLQQRREVVTRQQSNVTDHQNIGNPLEMGLNEFSQDILNAHYDD